MACTKNAILDISNDRLSMMTAIQQKIMKIRAATIISFPVGD